MTQESRRLSRDLRAGSAYSHHLTIPPFEARRLTFYAVAPAINPFSDDWISLYNREEIDDLTIGETTFIPEELEADFIVTDIRGNTYREPHPEAGAPRTISGTIATTLNRLRRAPRRALRRLHRSNRPDSSTT